MLKPASMEAITPPPNLGFSSKKNSPFSLLINCSVSGPNRLNFVRISFVCSIISSSLMMVAVVDSPDVTDVRILGTAPMKLPFLETYASTVYSIPLIYFWATYLFISIWDKI